MSRARRSPPPRSPRERFRGREPTPEHMRSPQRPRRELDWRSRDDGQRYRSRSPPLPPPGYYPGREGGYRGDRRPPSPRFSGDRPRSPSRYDYDPPPRRPAGSPPRREYGYSPPRRTRRSPTPHRGLTVRLNRSPSPPRRPLSPLPSRHRSPPPPPRHRSPVSRRRTPSPPRSSRRASSRSPPARTFSCRHSPGPSTSRRPRSPSPVRRQPLSPLKRPRSPSTSNPGSPPKRSTPVNPASLITSLGPSSGTTSPAIKGGETTVDVKPEPVDDAMDLDKPPSPLRQPKQEATPSPPRQTSNANWGKRSHDIKPKIETDGRPVDLIDTLSANSSTAIHPVPTPTEPRRRTTSHANPNMLGPGKAAAHDRNSPRIPSGSSPSHHSKHYVHSPSLDQGASQPSSGAPTPSQQHSPVVPPAHAPPKGPNVKREIPSGPRARGPQKAVAPPLVPSPKPKLIDIPPVVNVWVPPGALERDALEKRLREQQRAYQATLAVEVIKSGLDLDIALVELEASGQKWRMAESQLQRASKGFSLVEEQSSE